MLFTIIKTLNNVNSFIYMWIIKSFDLCAFNLFFTKGFGHFFSDLKIYLWTRSNQMTQLWLFFEFSNSVTNVSIKKDRLNLMLRNLAYSFSKVISTNSQNFEKNKLFNNCNHLFECNEQKMIHL